MTLLRRIARVFGGLGLAIVGGLIFVASVHAATNMAPVVVVSTYLVAPARLTHWTQAAQDAGLPLRLISAEQNTPADLAQALSGAQLAILDTPHGSVAQSLAIKFGPTLARSATPYVLVGDLASVSTQARFEAAPLLAQQGVGTGWAQRLREYWRYGGGVNQALALKLLSADGPRQTAEGWAAAVTLPSMGLYHPRWRNIERSTAALARLPQPREPVNSGAASSTRTVAIAVNPAVFTNADSDWLDHLIEALEQRGLRAYAFYGPRQQKDLFWTQTHGPQGERVADVLINAALIFNPTERKAELERIGIPVLQTMPALARDAQAWSQSRDGLAQSDVAYYYTPAELAGMVDPMLIAARHAQTGVTEAIPAQVSAVADKAAALVRLQSTAPAQRHVALLVYNYPAGEGNFGASFLNVPKSLHNMLAAMQQAGYQTTAPEADELTTEVQATLGAFYKPETLPNLLTQRLAEALPLADYLRWFRTLPVEIQRRIEAAWGAPERSPLLRTVQGKPAFVIPRVALGHVVVLPQPLRQAPDGGTAAKRAALGHRSAVPLSHQYLATYFWLRRQFGAHALVHVGTHGTVEWAPGKERALSIDDDPLLALGDVPNIYPYIMDNLGEAITAKRRGRAVMVSHSTPMFSPAGFRPKAQEMHELMHDWETVAPGPTKAEVEARLLEEFQSQQYPRDLGWTPEQIRANFAGFMEVLHPYLDELAQTAQPLGLATFGEVPTPERRLLTILQILRKPLIDALGEDIDEVFLLDASRLMQSRPARWLQLALRDAAAASRLDLRAEDAKKGVNLGGMSVPNRAAAKALDPQVLLALAQRAQQIDAVLSRNEEIEGFLAALDGRHLPASYGGDPVRNPESLPTGRNLYGFDPSRIPTRQAWDSGVAAFDAWMTQHRQTHGGAWPEKIAFTLWAGETLRHQGMMESQALYALGMQPRWDEAGRVVGVDPMPAQRLQRPRIDVLLSVTGSYRDQFPSVMAWLDQAAALAAQQGGADNRVARHNEALEAQLRARGASLEQARMWAKQRVYSNEQGVYGTGLSEGTLATEDWRQARAGGGDAQLTALYLARMGNAVGQGQGANAEGAVADDSGAARARQAAYAANLGQVDAALLSRTSNTYGMLTSDDPFQYLGGIAMAVRQLRGRDPALYVQNLRDESEVRTESAATAIAKEMQTRYLHPQWIRAQQAEGYSGTLQVLKTANFLWGWQVTAPQAVRQDQWQSLHDVYVRDQYRLGTREWLEGKNRTAYAQTLERMLDAVRLGYWQPDAATRRELAQAYQDAVLATDARLRHRAVRQFAQGLLGAGPARVVSPRATPSAPAASAAAVAASDATATATVRGLRMQVVQPEVSPASANLVVQRLASLLGVACMIAFGAWRQSRRGALLPQRGAT